MADSVKILQIGAMKMEKGLTEDLSPGWGQSGSEQTLSTGDAFPWLNFTKKKTVSVKEDNSINTDAFKDIPTKMTEYIENSISFNHRFGGINKFLYWAFGFETAPESLGKILFSVRVLSGSFATTAAAAGAVYNDDAGGLGNSFTYIRSETWNDVTYYIFKGTADSITGSVLYLQSGTGSDFTITAQSSKLYEHIFELDAHERHMLGYRTEEIISGWSAGDRKNRMATLGIRLADGDIIYRNSMVKSFGFNSKAGDFAKWDIDFIAYSDRRPGTQAAVTLPNDLSSSDNLCPHHLLKVEIGPDEDNLVEIGVTDIDFKCDIPLQVIQDTVSGIYIAEPVMEGKYGLDLNLTLSRYSATTYIGYTDAWTTVVVRISGFQSSSMFEIFFNNLKIDKSGPDDDMVAKESLHLIPGYSNDWSAFTDLLYGHTLIQKSPVVMRTRTGGSRNEMFKY